MRISAANRAISLLLMLASVVVWVLLPVDPFAALREEFEKRRRSALAEVYIRNNDIFLAKRIERNIDRTLLKSPLREMFEERLWSNYIMFPERYRDLPEDLVRQRLPQFIGFIEERAKLVGENQADPQAPSEPAESWRSEELLEEDLIDSVDELDQAVGILRIAIKNRKYGDDRRIRDAYLEMLDAYYQTRSLATQKFPDIEQRSRYSLVVYDAFRWGPPRVFDTMAEEIVVRPAEDNVLRIAAARYLMSGTRGKIAQERRLKLVGLVEETIKSIQLPRGEPLSDSDQEELAFMTNLLTLIDTASVYADFER